MSDNNLYSVHVARTFPGTAAQCGEVRAWLRALTRPFPQVRESIVLVASELFTNALQHTASGESNGQVEVSLSLEGDDSQTLRLEVVDQGTGPGLSRKAARAILPESGSLDGRGLFITSILSRAWGRFPAETPAENNVSNHSSGLQHEHSGPMVTWAEFHVPENAELAGSH